MDFVKFFEGSATDDKHRLLTEILGWSNHRLEIQHDYIQRVFPSMQPSMHDPNSPLITQDALALVRQSDAAAHNIRLMVDRFMDFLGFAKTSFNDHEYQYELPKQRPGWITSKNHNFKRVTRLLIFLRNVQIPGLEEPVHDIVEVAIAKWRADFGEETLSYWQPLLDANR